MIRYQTHPDWELVASSIALSGFFWKKHWFQVYPRATGSRAVQSIRKHKPRANFWNVYVSAIRNIHMRHAGIWTLARPVFRTEAADFALHAPHRRNILLNVIFNYLVHKFTFQMHGYSDNSRRIDTAEIIACQMVGWLFSITRIMPPRGWRKYADVLHIFFQKNASRRLFSPEESCTATLFP